jgi:hypothetical protein
MAIADLFGTRLDESCGGSFLAGGRMDKQTIEPVTFGYLRRVRECQP